MRKLKIQSLNMRGGRDFWKRLSIFQNLRKHNADIIFLQECHILNEDQVLWEQNWGKGSIFINPLSSRSGGQVILFKEKINVLEHKLIVDGRIHIVKLQVLDTILTLVNVYGPNKGNERKPFLDQLHDILTSYDYGDGIIIEGDFNIVPDTKLDKFKKLARVNIDSQTPSSSQNRLRMFKDTFNLIDIWRYRNKDAKRFTWSQPSPLVRCRLDYFLISGNLNKSVSSANILPSIKTDHSLIELTVNITGPQRGPGTWKLNVSVLKEEIYKNEMKLLINQAWDESNLLSDLSVHFDYLKYKIRQFSIDYCKKLSKSKKDKTTKLMKELMDLDCKICNEIINNEELIRYNELKQDLEFIEEENARGAFIRSRLEHIESDEKSTAFFFNASKQVYQK